MRKEVKILGLGYPKCKMLYENANKALNELGIPGEVIKVEDFNQIVAHGVLTTPALLIDGKVVSQGRILSVDEIKEFINRS